MDILKTSGFALRGVNFYPIFNASGSLNFFGEGWRNYHPLYKAIFGERFDFSGSTIPILLISRL